MCLHLQKINLLPRTMEFRTKVELPKIQDTIQHSDSLMLWGSCFTENIGKRLIDNKFSCDLNPFGILYNPMSIALAIRQILEDKEYTENDLTARNDEWFSYMHHSSFSAHDKETCLQRINGRLKEARKHLEEADWIIFTWGTSWVYQLTTTRTIVGNCHKMPDKMFIRSRVEAETIYTEYQSLIVEIRKLNPKVRFLFTVSPIRHAKDGMHGNQLSKSTLLLSIDKICKEITGCHYFPSYEIMMDELRDYRFYADDMLHPSSLAINYIWECFSETFFPDATQAIIKEWEKIERGLSHRPFNVQSDAHQRFLREILLKIELLKEKLPYLDVENEIKICQAQLKKSPQY